MSTIQLLSKDPINKPKINAHLHRHVKLYVENKYTKDDRFNVVCNFLNMVENEQKRQYNVYLALLKGDMKEITIMRATQEIEAFRSLFNSDFDTSNCDHNILYKIFGVRDEKGLGESKAEDSMPGVIANLFVFWTIMCERFCGMMYFLSKNPNKLNVKAIHERVHRLVSDIKSGVVCIDPKIQLTKGMVDLEGTDILYNITFELNEQGQLSVTGIKLD